MQRSSLLLALLLLASPASLLAASAAWAEDPAAVSAAITQAAIALAPPGATLSLGPVSAARVMPSCTAPLAVSLSGDIPYEQATIRCPTPAWTLYVSVTVAQSEAVAVTAQPVSAGQVIGPNDVMLRPEPVQNFAGRAIFTATASLIGATASLSLASGMVITQDVVQQPVLVKAGQMLAVQVISGAVVISVEAIASSQGRLGDTILFTNPSSGRRFPALITADGPQVRLQS